ncbi:MAG: DUF1292 domain-containing protein [Lachnospiraceae bacterium]|nr:DUF1292 domain-containing protein [Lachnospiraceae bacterium]
MNRLEFETEDGVTAFYVLEQTRINARNYLLVSESEDEDAEVLILKDTAQEQDTESVYEIVEDENELAAVLKVFEELLEENGTDD